MSVLALLIFVSLVFVALALALFAHAVRNEDFDHAEQLSLKPLEEEEGP